MGIVSVLEKPYTDNHHRICINNLDLHIHEDLRRLFIRTIEGKLPLTPTCACGKTTRSPLTPTIIPCHICHTLPTDDTTGDIHSLLYLAKPIGISKLVSITFWTMMQEAFQIGVGRNAFNFLHYATDTRYKIAPQYQNDFTTLRASPLPRGYNGFLDNLDAYLDLFMIYLKNKPKPNDVVSLYKSDPSAIFVDHIPFMSNITRVLEKSDSNRRAEDRFVNIVNIIVGVTNIDDPIHDGRREGMMTRFMKNYAMHWSKFLSTSIQGKHGYVKGTLYRARGNVIARVVASSITEPHNYNQIQLPWLATIYMFEVPITSILLNKGMTTTQIQAFIRHCTMNYNVTMHKLLDKLFIEGKDTISAVLQRFPSLTRGNLLGFEVTYKTIVNDLTVSISPLAIRSLNADFDGDSLHVSLFFDQVMREITSSLQFHNNCLDTVMPRRLRNLELTVPVENNLIRWLEGGVNNNPPTSEQLEMMKQFT